MMIPRRFQLVQKDSIVAFGVVWSDDSCSVRWFRDKDHMSFVFWPKMEIAVEQSFNSSGDKDLVQIEWIDHE